MKFSRKQLFHQSRDTRLLLRVAMRVGIASIVAGLLISLVSVRSDSSPFFSKARQHSGSFPMDLVPDPKHSSLDDWAQSIRYLENVDQFLDETADGLNPLLGRPFAEPIPDAPEPAPTLRESTKSSLADADLSETEKGLLRDLFDGLQGKDEPAAQARALSSLRQAAHETPPVPRSAEFLGDVLTETGDFNGAADAYRLEVDRFPGDCRYSLRHLAFLLRQEGRIAELNELMDRSELRAQFTLSDRINRAVIDRDYLGLLGLVVKRDLQIVDPWLVLLSLLAGGVWFAITTQFAGHRREQRWFYAAALILGFFSATATLYAVYIQEHIRGFAFDPSDDVFTQIIYCVAGIALREETLKLLFFLPLVPFLIRRGSEIDALICAGLVGLGFAFNENLGYVDRGGEFALWSRFLTANFAHIAWTGVAGLALYRCWRWPKRQWDNLLYDFLIVVASHGAYDALILVPALNDYSFATIVIYALISYLFLDHASHLMTPQGSLTISPLGLFVVGGALLLGVTFCYACWAVPFTDAVPEYVRSVAEVVPVAFIFINRLRVH